MFEYFLSEGLNGGRVGNVAKPFRPVMLSASGLNSSFGTVLLDYRVALAAQCILAATNRPLEARYSLPDDLVDRPYWDCTSFPTFWASETSRVDDVSAGIAFGGAAIWRLASPQAAKITVSSEANPDVRTKVLAAGDGMGQPAKVIELRPGGSMVLDGGPREMFIVQVNADPDGDRFHARDLPKRWVRSSCTASDSRCEGRAWTTVGPGPQQQPADHILRLSGLRTPILEISQDALLSMDVAFNLDSVGDGDGWVYGDPHASETLRNPNWPWPGCLLQGALVRIHVYALGTTAAEASGKAHGDRTVNLLPVGPAGYSTTDNVGSNQCGIRTDPRCDLATAASCGCCNLQGWSKCSAGDCLDEPQGSAWNATPFLPVEFSLAPFVGMAVQVELLVASVPSLSEFWVDNFVIRTSATPSVTLFSDDADTSTNPSLIEETYMPQALQGATRGSFDDPPVISELPPGFAADALLLKAEVRRHAPWSASWENRAKSARRGHIGWSYSSDIEDTRFATLRPGQEACPRGPASCLLWSYRGRSPSPHSLVCATRSA